MLHEDCDDYIDNDDVCYATDNEDEC